MDILSTYDHCTNVTCSSNILFQKEENVIINRLQTYNSLDKWETVENEINKLYYVMITLPWLLFIFIHVFRCHWPFFIVCCHGNCGFKECCCVQHDQEDQDLYDIFGDNIDGGGGKTCYCYDWCLRCFHCYPNYNWRVKRQQECQSRMSQGKTQFKQARRNNHTYNVFPLSDDQLSIRHNYDKNCKLVSNAFVIAAQLVYPLIGLLHFLSSSIEANKYNLTTKYEMLFDKSNNTNITTINVIYSNYQYGYHLPFFTYEIIFLFYVGFSLIQSKIKISRQVAEIHKHNGAINGAKFLNAKKIQENINATAYIVEFAICSSILLYSSIQFLIKIIDSNNSSVSW
jgi:hypothetical protein